LCEHQKSLTLFRSNASHCIRHRQQLWAAT